jgi:protein-tyrosine phosphatase
MRSFSTTLTIGIAAGFVTAVAAANTYDKVRLDDATVERSADGRVFVQWRSSPEGAPIDVAIALPGVRGTKLLSDDDRDGRHELTADEAARRPLVRLTTADGKELTTAERLLPLQGGRNFRDLGGYRASDGRRVKWGQVFRSGTMAQLTDSDYELLSTLGIRVVCDFRATDEREREPTVWRTSGTKADYRTRDYKLESSLSAVMRGGTPTPDTIKAAMTNFYGELAYTHADSFRTMFKALAAGQVPLAFNCSAGKDRTGLAAALLLTLLGVPRETVVDDYALSERIVDYEAEFVGKGKQTGVAKPNAAGSLAHLPPEVRAPLLRSDPDYIRAALKSIEQREGSIDAYFQRVLNITQDEQARIRELLLERS